MAAGVESLRKALGALKDSTLVGLAKVNGAKKGLDIAIVKATNHDEALANEKYMRIILNAVSASSPRTLISYCIHGLAKRLDKTHNWTVALKSLLVIHRALWEVGHPFCEELVIYSQRRGHILNLSHFKDESSTKAWDYSAWVRNYALYLEERLECFCTLKYEVDTVQQELDTPDLLEQLPALQQLLSRLLGCQPQGASMHNSLIQYALSIVASEGVKLYVTITDGIVSLVDTFFEMRHQDAVMALEIYRKSGKQAERLSEFYEICRALDFGRRQNFIKIEPLPEKFIATMENHVKEAPCTLMLECTVSAAPKEIADPEGGIVKDSYKLDVEGEMVASETSPVVPNNEHMAAETPQIPNLLDGGLEGLTPDSLYGYPKNIIPTQNEFMNNVWQVTSNPFEVVNCDQDPFYACSNVAPRTDVQMAAMAKQQNLMLHQQEGQDFPIGDKINPFGNPFVNMTVASLHRPQNSYSGLI